MEQLPSNEFNFKSFDLEVIRNALQTNLKNFFGNVLVEIVDCPDLSASPFNLATKGFGGGETGIIDLGGVPYLVPLVDRSKVYDLSKIIPKYIGTASDGFPHGFYISGAGAGPFPSQGSNSEMIVSMFLEKDGTLTNNKSKVVLTCSKDKVEVRELDEKESSCALLCNLMVSSGIPGKVLRLKCSKRIDKNTNLTASIRSSLSKEFGTDANDAIGLGGLFLVQNSKTKTHVMPDFSSTPLLTDQDVENWLQFYEMDPPMLYQSVLVSTDPGFDLRIEHSHGWSLCGKFGGHYHHDLSPDTVEYVAYYAVAQKLWRIDRPTSTHLVGRD